MATEVRNERFGRQSAPAETSFRHVLSTPGFYRLGFSVANRIPLGFLYSLADLVGDASFFRYKEKRESLRQNLVRVFPDMPAQEVHSLARRVFRNYARYLTDYGRFRGMSPMRKAFFPKVARLPADFLLIGSDFPTPAFELYADEQEVKNDFKAVVAGHFERVIIPQDNLLDVNWWQLRQAFPRHPLFTNFARKLAQA